MRTLRQEEELQLSRKAKADLNRKLLSLPNRKKALTSRLAKLEEEIGKVWTAAALCVVLRFFELCCIVSRCFELRCFELSCIVLRCVALI